MTTNDLVQEYTRLAREYHLTAPNHPKELFGNCTHPDCTRHHATIQEAQTDIRVSRKTEDTNFRSIVLKLLVAILYRQILKPEFFSTDNDREHQFLASHATRLAKDIQ